MKLLIETNEHAQMFEEMQLLEEDEKLSRKDARWNDVVTRAFRCRLDQDRCFDLGEPLRGHVATDLVDDAMAQKQVSLKLRAAQIEITILQTQIFARECVRSGIGLKRRRARIADGEQLRCVYFNVAGS